MANGFDPKKRSFDLIVLMVNFLVSCPFLKLLMDFTSAYLLIVFMFLCHVFFLLLFVLVSCRKFFMGWPKARYATLSNYMRECNP